MAKKNPAIIKRDTRKNWEKSKYIPNENVIIIMDNDDGTISLMIGDGVNNVNELPDLLITNPKSSLSTAKVNDSVLIL
jgi:hypothetical protein